MRGAIVEASQIVIQHDGSIHTSRQTKIAKSKADIPCYKYSC